MAEELFANILFILQKFRLIDLIDILLLALFIYFLLLLLRGKVRLLDQVIDVLVEVRVDELQFRRAVLVEQRHGGAVLDGLLEVVDRHVVAKNFLGAFLAGDQRRAGKGQEHRFG